MNAKQNKITLPQLIRLVAEATGTTDRVSELFLSELFVTISQALVDEDTVTIDGLGTFKTVTEERPGGKTRSNPVFIIAKEFAEKVNEPFAAFTAVALSEDLDADTLNGEIDAPAEPAQPTEPVPPTFKGGADNHEVEATSQVADVNEPEPQPAPQPEPQPEPVAEVSLPDDAPQVTPPPMPAAVADTTDAEVISTSADAEGDNTTPPPVSPVLAAEPTIERNDESDELSDEPPTQCGARFWQGFVAGGITTAIVAAICFAMMGNRGTDHVAPPVASNDTVSAASDSVNAATDSVTTTPQPAAEPAQPVVTEVATSTMYLTRMAAKHYGKQEFWVYIYEENKALIDDPNNVTPGTVLVIPPREKYGINPDDPQSVRAARNLQYRILSAQQ